MIGGATLQLSATFTSQDRFNQDASALHAMIPTMSDSGADVICLAKNSMLWLNAATICNSTGDYVNQSDCASPFLGQAGRAGHSLPGAVQHAVVFRLLQHLHGPLP
jgi:hypothetical protein